MPCSFSASLLDHQIVETRESHLTTLQPLGHVKPNNTLVSNSSFRLAYPPCGFYCHCVHWLIMFLSHMCSRWKSWPMQSWNVWESQSSGKEVVLYKLLMCLCGLPVPVYLIPSSEMNRWLRYVQLKLTHSLMGRDKKDTAFNKKNYVLNKV